MKEDVEVFQNSESNKRDISLGNVSQTGLKRSSVLNHLLKGEGTYEVKFILRSRIEDKHPPLKAVKHRITSFDVGFVILY